MTEKNNKVVYVSKEIMEKISDEMLRNMENCSVKVVVEPKLEELGISDLALEMIEKSANSVEILERDIEEVTNVQKGKFVPKKIGETSSKKVKPVRGKRYGR